MRVMLEKSFGTCNDFLLLTVSDAGSGTTKKSLVAQANLYKHQKIVLAHYQINFTTPATVVRGQSIKALVFKEG